VKKTVSLLLLTGCVLGAAAQTVHNGAEMQSATAAMCEAAGAKLQEAGTNQIVLMMTLSSKGRVESFKTDSPKGLKLEKVKQVATRVKAIPFAPAKKDGSPVAVQLRIAFDCARQPSSASQNQ
jgi:hypothetical protein